MDQQLTLFPGFTGEVSKEQFYMKSVLERLTLQQLTDCHNLVSDKKLKMFNSKSAGIKRLSKMEPASIKAALRHMEIVFDEVEFDSDGKPKPPRDTKTPKLTRKGKEFRRYTKDGHLVYTPSAEMLKKRMGRTLPAELIEALIREMTVGEFYLRGGTARHLLHGQMRGYLVVKEKP